MVDIMTIDPNHSLQFLSSIPECPGEKGNSSSIQQGAHPQQERIASVSIPFFQMLSGFLPQDITSMVRNYAAPSWVLIRLENREDIENEIENDILQDFAQIAHFYFGNISFNRKLIIELSPKSILPVHYERTQNQINTPLSLELNVQRLDSFYRKSNLWKLVSFTPETEHVRDLIYLNGLGMIYFKYPYNNTDNKELHPNDNEQLPYLLVKHDVTWLRGYRSNDKGTFAIAGTFFGKLGSNYIHGEGNMHYSNGDQYQGKWSRNQKDGYGTLSYKNGDVYAGDWMRNQKHGQGNLITQEGTYRGEWSLDKKNGQGEMYFSNGERYSGSWKDNLMHGNGKYIYEDNSIYEGSWSHGLIDGSGIYYYSDGRKEERKYIKGQLE